MGMSTRLVEAVLEHTRKDPPPKMEFRPSSSVLKLPTSFRAQELLLGFVMNTVTTRMFVPTRGVKEPS